MWTYDNAGNILTFNNGSGIHRYTYSDSAWGDLLTKYDGQTIDYDKIGNPTSYYNGTRWTFGWAEGRNLVSASGGGHTISYAYDHNGIRTTKTVDGVVHTYHYASGKLLRETYGDNVLDFFYDANGQPYAFKYNGTLYYYVLNLQGDVVRIVNSKGTSWGIYRYDAWGNILYQTDNAVMNANPLRYRGYVYDQETDLYYLQSRYYNPEIGRFINADAFASTGQGLLGNNMFAYCGNNPICYLDLSGDAYRPVGGGIQFELDKGGTTIGIEIILYWDVEECENGAPVIAVYVYGGISVGVNDPTIASIIGIITDNSDLLLDVNGAGTMLLASMVNDSFDVGASGVLIIGNDAFESTTNYGESFTSIGGGWGKWRGGIAYSETCFTVSLGRSFFGTNLLPSGNVSKSYYQQIFMLPIPNGKTSISPAQMS